MVLNRLETIFPEYRIYPNYRFYTDQEPQTQTENNISFYEFDVSLPLDYNLKCLRKKLFIPNLSLAFEYQGETHYFSTATFGLALARKKNDSLKDRFAKQMGITLIQVPFWWDWTTESLAATIRKCRYDLPLEEIAHFKAIPKEMPRRYLKKAKFKYKPNVPQLYDERIDPTGW
jgi:hypothetical protein